MWNEAKGYIQDFISSQFDYICSACFSTLGAIGRLFFEHKKYDGFELTFIYETIRLIFLAQICNAIVISVWQHFSIVSPFSAGIAIAAGLFAEEAIRAVKDMLPWIIKKLPAK